MSSPILTDSVKTWWREHSQSLCRLGEVFLSFGSGVLTIVSFGSPFWIEQVIEDSKSHHGLWQDCSGTPIKCGSLSNPSSAVLATRAMMILALINGIIGWVISMVTLVLHRAKYLSAAGIAFGLQAFFLFIGLLVYTKEVHSAENGHQGWSYSIGWIGFFVSTASCIIFILVALYIFRNPAAGGGGGGQGQQVYAPLNQWDSSSDSDEDQ